MTLRLFLWIVLVCCLAKSGSAEEEIKYPPPNGRFALRITQTKEHEDQPDGVGADFLFTLKFDHAGKWKIVNTHKMSQKEVEEE